MAKKHKSDKEKKVQKKESELIKFLKKRSFIYVGLMAVFLIFVIPDLLEGDLKSRLSDDAKGDEKIAIDLLKSYNGSNEKGLSVIDALSNQIDDSYPKEKIFGQNDTKLDLYAIGPMENSGNEIYEVHFYFETYKETLDYVWNVNIVTGEIQSVNSGAKKIKELVDYYD